MTAYYNEIDPYAAQWLRNLIAAGHIAPGEVDERSVVDVRVGDLRGFTQVHFCAGIGVWSYALRLAGWPDDRPVWTGSFPCQPFSSAGRQGGFGDERHLWPHGARLIRELEPECFFGEQVASADGLAWLDFVCADLEAAGYAVGAVDTCAAGVGAPHIRQRLYFVADAAGDRARNYEPEQERRSAAVIKPLGEAGELADADGRNASAEGLQRSGEHGLKPQDGGVGSGLALAEHGRHRRKRDGGAGWGESVGDRELGDAAEQGRQRGVEPDLCGKGRRSERRSTTGPSASPGGLGNAESDGRQGADIREAAGRPEGGTPTAGFWRDADWLPCIDGRARPVASQSFPLVDGSAFKLGSGSPLEGKSRVGMLRAYGNAIVGPVAAEFIRAFMETRP